MIARDRARLYPRKACLASGVRVQPRGDVVGAHARVANRISAFSGSKPIALATTTMADFSAEDIVEEMPALDALRAFLAYLDLTDANAMDAKLHRSGRHPDDLHWSSNPRYANKAKVAGRISSTDDSALFLKLTKERDMRAKQAALRKKRLAAARVDVTNRLGSAETAHDGAEATTSASRMDAALRSVFRAYGRYRRFDAASGNKQTSDGNDEKTSDPVQDADGVFEMDCLGWQKLVRDCAMLDNAATAVDLDDLFSRVDAGEVGYDERNRDERRRRAATGAKLGDAKLEYAEFKVLLRECAKRRYLPKQTQNAGASPAGFEPALAAKQKAARLDAAYAALLRDDILPRARGGISRAFMSDAQQTHPPLVTKRIARDDQYVLESLLGRAALNAFRAHDASLRRVYAHYATLEMYSASTKKITWRVIEATGATLNEDEFVCFLVNFDVVPHLMSRDESLEVFREVEKENDGDGNANEMAFPAFVETLGRLGVAAFRNAAPTLRNPRADVCAVRCFKKLVSAAPRDAWELGTLGGLFRERGFFTGANGGADLATHRPRPPPPAREKRESARRVDRDGFETGSDWRFGPGSRAANYDRLGRASDTHDPKAYEHDLYVHAHANQWTREDANARSVENAKARSEANRSARVSPPVSKVSKIANASRNASRSTFVPRGWVPSGVSDDVRSPGAGGLRAAYGYQQSPGDRMHWRVNEKRDARPEPRLKTRVAGAVANATRLDSGSDDVFVDRAIADRAWSMLERSDRNETTGRPWVPGSVPSYDRLRPERFNLTESFHASARDASGPFSFAKQTHAPVRDAFAAPVERPVPMSRRSVAFDPPVERPGYDDAVGGLVTRKKRGDEDRLASEPDADGYAPPTDEDPDAANAVDRAMRSLEIDRAATRSATRGEYALLRVPVMASPGSRVPASSATSTSSPPATQTSPGYTGDVSFHNAPLTDAVRIAAPGTYAYGLGTSFARPGQVIDPGVAFSRRASVDLDSFPSRDPKPRRRRGDAFASLPHPAVAEVANLDWFEDLRGKALRQRGLPSTKFLSTWQEKLGTKERRTRDEADVEAVKRGLRAGMANR